LNAADLLVALDLPAGAHVDRRVPKTMLHEYGAPTAADKRRISDGIEQLVWVAALKPTTIGVAEYRDDVREYLEIAVLHLTFRAEAKADRLIELVHRAVPYPVVLVVDQSERAHLSLAHKRWSQGEAAKTVLDGEVVGVNWDETADEPHAPAFSDALALGRQPRVTLFPLYQGWVDTVLTLKAARRTGAFTPPSSPDRAAVRRAALQECDQLDATILRLRSAAAKEKQMPLRVELNLELKRVEAAKAATMTRL
jgi:hypothetical protein